MQDTYRDTKLTEEDREKIAKHYKNLKIEMLVDSKDLSEQNSIKKLEAEISYLEKRFQRISQENDSLNVELQKECDDIEAKKNKEQILAAELKTIEMQEQQANGDITAKIKELIVQNEIMKSKETEFKEHCTTIIKELHQKIEEAAVLAETPEDDSSEHDQLFEKDKETLRLCRLQLAKRNRAVISFQRQLDNIPDSTELAQYQKRFFELYNNISVKHKETKQYYALFNTLNDTHLYLEKELSILNSIYDNYNQ